MPHARRDHAGRAGPPAPRTGRAFSLVELLTVVAILAILVALIMPALGRAKLIAQKVTCQTRLKQIGRAAKQYALDNNGYGVKIHPTSTTCFSDALLPQLHSEEIFWCPSAALMTNRAKNGKRLDYGMNHHGHGYESDSAEAARHYNTFNALQIHSVGFEDVIYFAEAETDSSPEDIGGVSRGLMKWPIYWSFEKHAHNRHLDGYNYYMLNGSAGWFATEPPTNEKWFIRKEQAP